MKYIVTLSLATQFLFLGTTAQDTLSASTSPYKTSFKKDAPIIIGGLGLTALGVKLINDRPDITPAKLAVESKQSVPFFDRGNVGYYNEKADDDSYIPFKLSFGMPIAMALLNKNERQHFGQVMVLYLETMAVTGTLFTLSAGLADRSRPYVYGENTPLDKRLGKTGQRSFFAGHTAATAAATFYTAQAFADFNPDSKLKPVVWGVAAAVPALVGYLRYKGGMHFLSDNILGYAIGAGAGILVPKLHKTKMMKQISLVPFAEGKSKGFAAVYYFR
jgi:membrane-associated phospholipid phosphatase